VSRQAATLVLGMLPLALLAACTSARAHLYTLEETPRETAVAIGERPTVVLGPISLPEMVDRPQLAVREGAYGVTIHEQERWAAPLKESLPRLLARELTRRVDDRRFVPASGVAINGPNARLLIDISTLDMAPTGVGLSTHWVYRPLLQDAMPIEGDTETHAEITLGGYAGYVDALRRAALAVADEIAGQLAKHAVR
jgi:uncharacterized protein